ncbi:MAG TPA: hypothetical protein VFW54_04040, partial [Propionibacteriaceae bacterium]|nr:hypothetical protein [Propionibacteriaceae bacterium]
MPTVPDAVSRPAGNFTPDARMGRNRALNLIWSEVSSVVGCKLSGPSSRPTAMLPIKTGIP